MTKSDIFERTAIAEEAFKKALKAAVTAREEWPPEDLYHMVKGAIADVDLSPQQKQCVACSAMMAALTHSDDAPNLHPYSRWGLQLYEIIASAVFDAAEQLKPKLGLGNDDPVPTPDWTDSLD